MSKVNESFDPKSTMDRNHKFYNKYTELPQAKQDIVRELFANP